MSFGFSVGDFITALELVATVIDALRESGGASSEYREIIRQLYSLETALISVKRLEVDPAQNAELVSLQQAAAQCRLTIDSFWKKVQKYQPHLRAGGSSSRLKDGWMKIQWAMCKKEDVARFKADLVGHTESIQLLLMAMQMYERVSRLTNRSMANFLKTGLRQPYMRNATNNKPRASLEGFRIRILGVCSVYQT